MGTSWVIRAFKIRDYQPMITLSKPLSSRFSNTALCFSVQLVLEQFNSWSQFNGLSYAKSEVHAENSTGYV